MTSSWLGNILLRNSTSRYFITYKHFYFNHLAHGVIALERLGATEQRVNTFINRYTPKLEKPQEADHSDEGVDANPPSSDEDVVLLIGKRRSYYSLLNYYKNKLEECGSMEMLLKTHFPKLREGVATSLLHGLIHIGYGFAARSKIVLCEGMASLHQSYVPVRYDNTLPENNIDNFGKGSTNILDVLKKIKEDEELKSIMLRGAKRYRESGWISGGLQYRMAAILDYGDIVIKYANDIKVTMDGNPGEETDEEYVTRLADWLFDQSIILYTFSETKNNFVLLHGVTCAWSVRQIIPCLEPADALVTLRAFTCVLLAAYVNQNCPAIEIQDEPIPAMDQSAWNSMIEDGCLQNENDDVHTSKLVQVCYDCWKNLKDKDHPMAGIYFAAARVCLDNDFFFLKSI